MKVINFPERTQDLGAHNQRWMVNTLYAELLTMVCSMLVDITNEPCTKNDLKKYNRSRIEYPTQWEHMERAYRQQTVRWSDRMHTHEADPSTEKLMAWRRVVQHGNGQIPAVRRKKKISDSIRESCRDKQAFTGRLEIALGGRTGEPREKKQTMKTFLHSPFCLRFSSGRIFCSLFAFFFVRSLAATMDNDTLHTSSPGWGKMVLIFELCHKISFQLICFRTRQEHNHIQFRILSQSQWKN